MPGLARTTTNNNRFLANVGLPVELDSVAAQARAYPLVVAPARQIPIQETSFKPHSAIGVLGEVDVTARAYLHRTEQAWCPLVSFAILEMRVRRGGVGARLTEVRMIGYAVVAAAGGHAQCAANSPSPAFDMLNSNPSPRRLGATQCDGPGINGVRQR